MRIFYATDVHGSDVCWRKFLNAGAFHKADVLIMGGDMTGKAMVPIVANGSGWDVTIQDQHHALATEAELVAMEKRISDRGYYPVRLSRDEVNAWSDDPEPGRRPLQGRDRPRRRALDGDRRREAARLAGPLHRLAGQRRHVRDRRDHRAGELRRSSAKAVRSTSKDLTMISTGWTNPTPWNTFRELPEDQLRAKIDELVEGGARPASGDLQLPCPAVRLEPRQRPQARRRDELRVRRPGARPGRLARGPRGDPRSTDPCSRCTATSTRAAARSSSAVPWP